MSSKKSLSLIAVLGLLVIAGPAYAGPNANAVLSLDLIPGGGAGNRTDDGVASGTVSGRGTTIAVEVFATAVRTSLIGLTIEFDFDASLLSYVKAENSAFPLTLPEGSTGTHFATRNPATLSSSGFLARAEFTTVSDVTGTEFSIGIESVTLAESTTSSDELATTTAISFNSAPSPDLDGDDYVGFSDFLIFASVFGSRQGDGTYDAGIDLNSDGSIGFTDFLIFAASFGGPPPSTGGGNGGSPDLVVQSPSVSNNNVASGATFTLGATVRNQGNGSSAATTLRYYRSTDATVSTSDTRVGTDAVSGLSASGSSAESINLTAPSGAGSYYYGACVDAVSGESNTGNNRSPAATLTVTTQPPPPAGASKLYWTDWGTDKIQRANLDGSGVEDLVTSGVSSPTGFALDVSGGKMYWTDRRTDKIQCANLNGSGVEDLVTTGLNSPNGLALDVSGGKMYWADAGTNKVQRASLDGSGVEDLVTGANGLVDPSGVAVGAASSGGGSGPGSGGGNGGGGGGADQSRTTFESSTPSGYERITLNDDGSVWGVPTRHTTDSEVGTVAYMLLGTVKGCTFANAEVDRPSKVYIKTESLGRLPSFESATVCRKTSRAWTTSWNGARITHLRFFDESSSTNAREAVYNASTGQMELDGVGVGGGTGGGGGAADLVVVSPFVSNSSPAAGASFTLGASVRNQGDGVSAATTLRYYRSSDATISTSDTEVGTNAVSGLPASGGNGGSIDLALSIDLTAPSGAGTYYYGACVDAVTGESDTGNNCSAAVSVTVASQPPPPPTTVASKLYWTDWGTDKIQRADLDGSNVEDLVSSAGLNGPDGLALDMAGGKMYWTDAGTSKIQRADLDGSNVEDLITSGLSVPYGLAVDVSDGKMYWTDRQNGKIQRADLDGSNVEDLITLAGLAFPGEIALDVANGKIYWTNPGSDKIQRADLDGSNVEDLVSSGLSSPTGLALDVSGGKMYWTDRGTSRIQRASLDGSGVEDLVISGLTTPNGLDLDVSGGKMYWTDVDADKVQRADLDGSNVEDLLTSADGLVDPSGLAVGAAGGSSGGTYGVGDALPNFPIGFFVPRRLTGASLTSSGGRTVLSFQNGGLIELQDGTRYTCVAAGGCSIEGGRVTRGTFE